MSYTYITNKLQNEKSYIKIYITDYEMHDLFCLQISCPLSVMRIVYAKQDGYNILFTLRENVSVTQTAIWKMYIWTMEIVVRICPSILFIVLNSLVIKRFLQLSVQNRQFHAASDKLRANNAPDTSLLSRNRGYR